MKDINASRLIRNCVMGFKPYIPGMPISEIKKRFKLKNIIKLASNENPLGPSKKINKAIVNALGDLHLYPVGNSQSLKEAVASKYKLNTGELVAGSGTDELIELLCKTFCNPEDNIVVSKHAFIRYKMAGELMNCAIKEVPMVNFTHDLSGMLSRVDKSTKIVFIANPNNPTGTYVNRIKLESFLSKLPDNVLVCLDEAYFEYAALNKDFPDGISLYKMGYPNVVALRTFSKIYGLAGLRVGFAAGNPGVIGAIDRVRPPFNVNSIAQLAAQISLGDTMQVGKSQRLVKTQKDRFYKFLRKNNIQYIESAANFVLLKTDVFGMSGMDLFNRMLQSGIIVREMSEYELPDWVRITISLPKDMDYLFKVLKSLLDDGKN